jgi:hypothetical protein
MMKMMNNLVDIIDLIKLVTKEEELTEIELEHLFNMLVVVYDELP